MNEESLFVAALERPDPAQRRAFLDEACAGDAPLRRRVEHLLATDEAATGILDHGPNAAAVLGAYRPASPLAAGQVFAGRFRLCEKLGEGGMGEVWVAEQTEPVQRRVALKVIRSGLGSARQVARFEAECQTVALMDHPNIAKVHDAGVADGRPFFVMELIEGVPLTRYCDEARLPLRERLALFVAVCQAVQHAHQKGIIHRDLKPPNVLVTLYDGRPVPKVIDFGIAKVAGPRPRPSGVSTEFGAIIGTLEYMSPEQAEASDHDIDTRSDIYALGALLYELLTGGVPFSRQQLQAVPLSEMLRIIKEVEPPTPSARLSDPETSPNIAAARQAEPRKLAALVRGELDWIVMKCLEKDRGRRYETANALALDVGRYLTDEPVLAGPPSVGYRVRKVASRHRRVLAAAVAFVLLLVTSVVALSIVLVAVNWERQQKEAALAVEAKRKKQARGAFDAMSSFMIEELLLKQTVLLPNHKQFLEEALHAYEEFAADTGKDEESRAGVAHAYWRVGAIRRRLGQRKEAAAALEISRERYAQLVADFPAAVGHRETLAKVYLVLSSLASDEGQIREAETILAQGLSVYRDLAADFPDVPEFQHRVAMALDRRGILLKNLSRLQDAEEAYGQALDIHKRLAADFPAKLRYLSELAQTNLNLGLLLDIANRQDEAERHAGEAVAIYDRLVVQDPADLDYRTWQVISRNNLGSMLRGAGKYPAAEAIFRQALPMQQQLVTEYPLVPELRRSMAMTLNNLGILLKDTDRAADAEEMYGQSLAVHKRLAADFPKVLNHRNEVAGAMVNLARLLLESKKFHAARGLLEEALPHHQAALKGNQNHPSYRKFYRLNRWRMAETLLALNDHAGAAAATREFLQVAFEPPRDAYTAACLLAGCVRLAAQDESLTVVKRQELAAAYGAGALAALRQAIERRAKEVTQMAKDASLDPLRSRPDFQKLLAEVEAKSKP